jgi:AcrR family transcriptional regulator
MKQQALESDSPPAKTPAAPSHGRRRHMPAAARREQILTAALSCFGEKGYHASTMDDLVRASGLSKGSLYWHFQSKEEVFLALFDSFSEELYGGWDSVAESGADALEVLRGGWEFTVQSFSSQRIFLLAWADFFNHPAGRTRMSDAYKIARHKFEAIIERGREAGSLRSGAPANMVAAGLVASLEGLFLQWLVDPTFDLEANVAVSWEILVEGLRA